MPRVTVYEGGNIQRQGTTGARFRPADYGPSAFGEGLQKIGQTMADAVERQDKIEDINARVEANRLAVEHSEHVRQIGQTVQQTLGENADAAAQNGITELDKASNELLGRASPRARALLENEIRLRSGVAADGWLDHGFRQKGEALETSSVARISRVVEDAADTEDEGAALAMLGEVRDLNEKRASFFGKGQDWLIDEDRKVVSNFYKSRALKLAQGQAGSASAAIGYAEKNRSNMTDQDYLSLVGAYNDAAQEETAVSMIYGASPIGAAVEPAPATDDGGSPVRLDPMAFFKAFTVPHEGSKLVIDSNGAAVKYGINAEHNPGVNIAGLTENAAGKIFTEKYFKKSGADKLPPALAAVHVDTFFLNEREAAKILKQSGGDVDKYIELRSAFLNGLVAKNPAKYGRYQAGWTNRTKALADYADRQGGDGTPLPVDPSTNLEGLRQAVMSRTDIGMNLKRKLINAVESRRSEVTQERNIQEAETERGLMSSALGLGDNFTSVKQLPQNLWLNASPSTRSQFTNMAESNVKAAENKPLSPQLAATVGFLQTFRPESLADPATLQLLAKKGVPAGTLRQLAEYGGKARGTLAGAKADPIPRSTLESIARPAFESAGHFLWTTEAGSGEKDKGKALAERQLDAARSGQLLSYLNETAEIWAVNNPGKRPDEKTMKGWVGGAMIRAQNGQPIGTMSDAQLVLNMSETDRRTINRKLRDAGMPVTAENVATYYRRTFAARAR